jgi:uncharacterized cupredoxin-like copper-binding protein
MRVLLIAALLFACACQRQAEDVSRNGSTAAANTPPSAAMSTNANPKEAPEAGGGPTLAQGATQEVDLIEYQINLPETLPAGRTTFNIENGGKEEHAFVIEGNGIEKKSAELQRGDTTSLDVTLAPGTYTIYCPVDGHKDKGMKRTLTVR